MRMGILSINKDKNMTSHDVVAIIRKKLNMKQIGHTGTLDPMATGVLPICVGRATKLAPYIVEQGKSYIAELKFGAQTSTYDSEGEIINEKYDFNFNKNDIEDVLKGFTGKIDQIPPIYSAIKVNGKKLYDYARQGLDVEIKARPVTIYKLDLLQYKENYAKIYIECSKGTYIRSLINDIGIKLGTYAHMTSLIRTSVGNFDIKDSISIDDLKTLETNQIFDKMVNNKDALYNMNEFVVSDNIKFRLVNGQRINIKDTPNILKYIKPEEDFKIIYNDELLGIGKITDNILKMEKLIWQE